MKVNIYIEVEYHGKGSGGWGKYYAILETFLSNDQPFTIDEIGGLKDTTKNRLLLTGCINALKRLKGCCEVEIYTSSPYLTEAMNQKLTYQWLASGWVRRDNQPVKNQDLWEEYLRLENNHLILAENIKHHSYSDYQKRQLRALKIDLKEDKGGNLNV